MRKLIVVLAAVACLGATGCATKSTYTPPSTYTESNSMVFSGSFEKVWKTAISAIGEDFFVIDNIAKDSKIITLTFSADNPDEYVDCGSTTVSTPGHGTFSFKAAQKRADVVATLGGAAAFPIAREVSLNGKMNIIFAEESPKRTKVTVNVRYVLGIDTTVLPYGAKNSKTVTLNTGKEGHGQTIKCVSRYTLEKSILERIQRKL